jgi:hypothetical protein
VRRLPTAFAISVALHGAATVYVSLHGLGKPEIGQATPQRRGEPLRVMDVEIVQLLPDMPTTPVVPGVNAPPGTVAGASHATASPGVRISTGHPRSSVETSHPADRPTHSPLMTMRDAGCYDQPEEPFAEQREMAAFIYELAADMERRSELFGARWIICPDAMNGRVLIGLSGQQEAALAEEFAASVIASSELA